MKKQENQKKKSYKVLWIILAIVAVVVIAIVVMAVNALNAMTEQMTTMMDNTATVEIGQIEVTTEGSGVIKSAQETNIYVDYNVTLHKLYKQDGERAEEGEMIAEFDSVVSDSSIAALEAQLQQVDSELGYITKTDATTVKAPVAGRVKRIYAKEGDSVLAVQSESHALALISADGNLKVRFTPEVSVEEGQKVTVLYDSTTVNGRIEDVQSGKAVAVFEDGEQYDIEKEVTVQSEDGTILGMGLTECGHEVYVTANSGYIKSISVKENDKVSAGTAIFNLEDVSHSQEYVALLEQREQLAKEIEIAKEYRKGYVVVAERECIVSGLTAREGDALPAGTLLCKLMDATSYQVVIGIDELDIQGIEQGQSVEVTVDAIEDVVYQGFVSSVSLAGENEGGVGSYKVSVMLEDAKNLLPGMSANGRITIAQREETLLVPIDALQTIDGKKSVNVLTEEGTYETREVTVGLVNNDYAEILEGVKEGEELQVVVRLQDFYEQMGITIEEY